MDAAGKERPPLPIFTYYVVPQLIISLVLALRLRFGLKLLAWCLVTTTYIYALRFNTGDVHQNYSTGTSFAMTSLTAVQLLLLSDPIVEYRHTTQETSLTEFPLWKRFYYALCILVSVRGVGWNYQIHNIPPIPRYTRLQFIGSRVLRITWYALLADMAQTFIALNPIFWLPEERARSIRSQGLILNVFNILGFTGRSYCLMNFYYDIIAMVLVAFGLSEPQYWPVIFGRWRDAYTIRRFWGQVWHQWLRRFVSGMGKFAANTLGCKKGTWISSNVQLFVGFTVSGLAHVAGDAMVHPKWTGISYWFFLTQVFAITFEDFVIARGKQFGVRDTLWTRLLGYTWTFGWFVYSTPWHIDSTIAAGGAQGNVAPFSVVDPLLSYVVVSTGMDVKAWIAMKCAL